MASFVNRELELQGLNRFIEQPGAHFVVVYGRRRVGKTTLLTTWAEQSGLPTLYWVAKRDPARALMANLAQTVYAWEHGLDQADIEIHPPSWEAVFQMIAQAVGSRRAIVILDELPYALQQDAGMGSHIQAAWDHMFKDSQILLFLAGSHVGIMTELMSYQAPLYGRLTAQLPVMPLSFASIREFLPRYDVHKRLAVYAILGGVPAYLERWDDRGTLGANVERLFLQRTGWFRNEPLVLVSDLTQRETTNYEAILKAIADGRHNREEIAAFTAIPTSAMSHYLPRLMDLKLVERRVPATVPLAQIKTSKQSRYHLSDPFLRFYYRFVDPNLHLIERGLTHRLWQMMEDNFRAFVALSFEDLCRDWVLRQAQAGGLPFMPDNVGTHWSPDVQVDVVAIAWREKQILLGECKWGEQPVNRSVVTELIQTKTPKVLHTLPDKGEGWTVHYAFFGRSEFSAAAQSEAAQVHAQLLNLEHLERDLAKQ
ncbi:MAG: ATP-binding protein [Thermoflexales bacterium]|nr:ATP-binding protein [Thermoflexales bacterium]